jgi:hypothetical protein
MQRLEWLRQQALQRLDSIETLARQRSASEPAETESAALKRTLEQKLADLEETEHRLHAQAEGREKEWKAALAQLEADRRLLAEAWERLERERIDEFGASEQDPRLRAQAHGDGPQKRAPAAPPPEGALAIASAPNQSAAQAILRQYETLCSDVRRNAKNRRNSR